MFFGAKSHRSPKVVALSYGEILFSPDMSAGTIVIISYQHMMKWFPWDSFTILKVEPITDALIQFSPKEATSIRVILRGRNVSLY